MPFIKKHTGTWAVVALSLAAGAQYALAQRQLVLGALGYVLAAGLFVIVLRDAMPDNSATQPPAAGMPSATRSEQPVLATVKPSFWTHWRYYTIADLLAGRQPKTPTPAATVSAGALVVAAQPVKTEPASTAPTHDGASASTDPAAKRAVVTAWRGFVEPQAVVVTHQGHVLLIDAGQGMAFRFDAQGQPTGRWLLPDLPPLHGANLAASPDGATLYIADATNHQVYVIKLVD